MKKAAFIVGGQYGLGYTQRDTPFALRIDLLEAAGDQKDFRGI
jgi:hypothetical protein